MAAKRSTHPLPPEALPLQERIADWRTTRRGGTAMPSDLWAEAADLARKHGTYAIARGLPVDFGALQQRVDAVPEVEGRQATGPDCPCSARDAVDGRAFVEVEPLLPFDEERVAGPRIEMTRPDGARLVVRLCGGASVDLAGLAIAFCGGGA